MPPRKTTSTSQPARSNSRKRLSSQTDENQTQDLEQENLNQTPSLKNDDDQTNSSSNSDTDPVEPDEVEDDAKDKKPEPKKTKAKADKLTVGGEPEGEIIRLGEELKFSATKHKGFAVVDNDVYREFQLRGTKRVAYQLVYTAGTAIPLSKLNETK